MTRVGFLRWRSALASGGNRYDEEISARLRALGLDLHEYAVPGSWPEPGPNDRQQLLAVLAAERDWLIGNIVGSAAPEVIAAAVTAGRRVSLLMHYFPADDPSLTASEQERVAAAEARAVEAASTILVTSVWAAAEVGARYGRTDTVVAAPGVAPADLAPGSSAGGRPPQLLWLGRLTRTKDPLTFVDALTRVQDLDWDARLVGPVTVDENVSRAVRARITQIGLDARVAVPGPCDGTALEAVWARTDLLVHTSRAETFGMVVSEALARGIPSVVPSGTGAAEAQRVGATFPPGDPVALADALRTWLRDPRLRHRWRAKAADLRGLLPTWDATARIVYAALTG